MSELRFLEDFNTDYITFSQNNINLSPTFKSLILRTTPYENPIEIQKSQHNLSYHILTYIQILSISFSYPVKLHDSIATNIHQQSTHKRQYTKHGKLKSPLR